jgi:hypothetical protein
MTLWLCTVVLVIVCSYQRRNKFNPLWNEVLVAGYKNGKPFLGQLDMIGTAFEDNCLATGFGTLSCPTHAEHNHRGGPSQVQVADSGSSDPPTPCLLVCRVVHGAAHHAQPLARGPDGGGGAGTAGGRAAGALLQGLPRTQPHPDRQGTTDKQPISWSLGNK